MTLEDIDNEDLIHIDPTQFSDEELMQEQERCQEVIDLHVMAGGIDLTYWYDRVNSIEQMRLARRQKLDWQATQQLVSDMEQDGTL